jgi:hypothetical protein
LPLSRFYFSAHFSLFTFFFHLIRRELHLLRFSSSDEVLQFSLCAQGGVPFRCSFYLFDFDFVRFLLKGTCSFFLFNFLEGERKGLAWFQKIKVKLEGKVTGAAHYSASVLFYFALEVALFLVPRM